MIRQRQMQRIIRLQMPAGNYIHAHLKAQKGNGYGHFLTKALSGGPGSSIPGEIVFPARIFIPFAPFSSTVLLL